MVDEVRVRPYAIMRFGGTRQSRAPAQMSSVIPRQECGAQPLQRLSLTLRLSLTVNTCAAHYKSVIVPCEPLLTLLEALVCLNSCRGGGDAWRNICSESRSRYASSPCFESARAPTSHDPLLPASSLATLWDASRHLVGVPANSAEQYSPVTTGKFFGKTGEPPVQTKLEDAFGGKRKRTAKVEIKEQEKPVDAEEAVKEGVHAVAVLHLSPPIHASASRSQSPAKDGEVVQASMLRVCSPQRE